MKNNNKQQLKKRQVRIRAKLKRLSNRLRLSVYRSNEHIYGQVIDDKQGKTLVSACDQELADKTNREKKMTKLEIAKEVGKLLAVKTKKNKINEVYFDRSGYKYHGRIKALAEGAREGGLVF